MKEGKSTMVSHTDAGEHNNDNDSENENENENENGEAKRRGWRRKPQDDNYNKNCHTLRPFPIPTSNNRSPS